MIRKLLPVLGKSMVVAFFFATATAFWFWAISSWTLLSVTIAIVYTIAILMFFDKAMMNRRLD